ncbi:MAG TPA: hypothetical protein VI197_06975 [Polyangiaceae bacterium]
MLPHRTLIVCSLVLLASACSRPQWTTRPLRSLPGESARPGVSDASFRALLERFTENERRIAWSDAECQHVGRGFAELSARHERRTGRPLAAASYNAGLAFRRCGAEAEAKRHFRRAGTLPAARTELVVVEHGAAPNLERSIERLRRIVSDSRFQEPRALVLLAALELERARELPDATAARELARANLQRALAIDDGYLPALNQLAIYYLDLARAHADQSGRDRAELSRPGAEPPKLSRRHLDLASFAVERALARDPSYAPAHNTEGVIHFELGNYTGAARAFARARQLDPRFLEAHMNYAALNLRFRGFSAAEHAYRAALALQPKNYEAHLGLAVALRGQLAAANQSGLSLEIERQLALAAKVAPLRPEVDYNRALFALARQRTLLGADNIRALQEARAAFDRFVAKAGDEPEYARDVAKAREHLADLRDTLPFLHPEP